MRALRRGVWLFGLGVAGPAQAHAPAPGVEGFFLGLAHPLTAPSQILVILALALVVGGFATRFLPAMLGVFCAASLALLLAGPVLAGLDVPLFSVAFVAAVAAASLPGQGAPVAFVLLALGGGLIGQASIPDAGPLQDRIFTMVGSLTGASLGVAYIVGLIVVLRERVRAPWVPIGMRVAAAWVAAIALVMMALSFAPVPAV